MPTKDELLKEWKEVRERYEAIIAQLIKAGVPGFVDLGRAAAGCNVGEVCHGGQFRNLGDLGDPAERATSTK
jgi:hypothetical protein